MRHPSRTVLHTWPCAVLPLLSTFLTAPFLSVGSGCVCTCATGLPCAEARGLIFCCLLQLALIPSFFFEIGSLTESLTQLDWLAIKPQVASCLFPLIFSIAKIEEHRP